MEQTYTRTGELREGRSIILDEAVPVAVGHVRVTVQPIARTGMRRTRADVLERIRTRQRNRGHVAAQKEDVDRSLATERASWT